MRTPISHKMQGRKRDAPDEIEVDQVKESFNGRRKAQYRNLFSLISWCRAIGSHYEKEYKKEQAKKIIPKRYHLYTQKYLESRPSEADELLINLRKALCFFDGIGYARSAHQRKFHESFIAACTYYLQRRRCAVSCYFCFH